MTYAIAILCLCLTLTAGVHTRTDCHPGGRIIAPGDTLCLSCHDATTGRTTMRIDGTVIGQYEQWTVTSTGK